MGARGRDELVREALERTNWDLLVCALPSNVLLLSGYWPGLGHSLAAVDRSGRIFLVVPEDEADLAERSWADEIATYQPISLERVTTPEENLQDAFADIRRTSGIKADRIGFEQADLIEPSVYTPHLFRGNAARIIRRCFPAATLAPADEMLAELRTTKTPGEIAHIRQACRIAEQGFLQGSRVLRAGLNEAQTAAAFRVPLSSCVSSAAGTQRCDGFVYCASGQNTARAHGPYGRSRVKSIEAGDTVICRCHCYSDGYWADVARTYHIGPLQTMLRRMFDAVLASRDEALKAIRPGARGADVHNAARGVLERHGFGAACPHPTGHGAGFGAADYSERPRLHPQSEDVLTPGMVVKLEPGIYVDGVGGVRHADMVAVGEDGPEVLTPLHWEAHDMRINFLKSHREIGFTWYSLQDQVDWDTGPRKQ
jgi:Xaa-Pro dipeptidase